MGNLVIKYFKMGIYKDDNLPLFVSAGFITQEQADTIINSKSRK